MKFVKKYNDVKESVGSQHKKVKRKSYKKIRYLLEIKILYSNLRNFLIFVYQKFDNKIIEK